MIYFLNQYIKALNSSVEHAEFKRLALFKHERVNAKIVTRDYDNLGHLNAATFGLNQDDVLNMYDYFQGTTDVTEKTTSFKTLKVPIRYQLHYGSDVTQAFDGGRLAFEIHHTPGRVGEIASVDHFDAFGHVVKRDLWDSRGFKSATQFLDFDGDPHTEILYHQDGTRALERFYEVTDDHQGKVLFNFHLINYRGNDYYFNTEDDLFTFFLDELNQQVKGQNVFIADRPVATDIPMLHMKTRAKKYLFFPILHAANPEDLVHSDLEPSYQEVFNHLDKLDGLITMTESQANQIRIRLKHQKGKGRNIKITVIPGAYVPNDRLKTQPVSPRQKANRVIYVGRLGADKGVDNLLRAFALVVPQVPDAVLDIRGFGDQAFLDSLHQLADQLQIADHVELNGYTADIDPAYDAAKVFVSAAHQDAFPLAMVEALSHGLPVVAFDTNFGPKQIITDGVNGFLMAPGDLYGFAQQVIALLTKGRQLQDMGANAFNSAKDYDAKHIWKQWKTTGILNGGQRK
ncbi:glycosyltransferase, group 1 family protein [Lentilactobacillus parafarraginis F0439]|uniref:Glycosyltransferase, group 1 family protein n=1 Tax=Lentilactobacillus parafarraginis F0439 TaxID=797515 RepID=G9ZJX7_9LACO|nr:glycosyltransferase [Lentilactobacillus parafarraginis]EHM01626.1 glycosyltransferase, group 1 family protein [Lentilactobacillus parafarraginis F0439]